MEPLVRYHADGPVARLTLDSPRNRNALSTALVEQLHDGLTRASAEQGVRVVVLGHTGGTFCAGADLSEASADGSGTPAELAAILPDYDALIVRSQVQVDAELIAAGTRMVVIGRAGVGVDNVDLDAATRAGITVVNAPTISIPPWRRIS